MSRRYLLMAFASLLLFPGTPAAAHDGDGKDLGNASPPGSGGEGPFSADRVALLSRLRLDEIGGGGSVWGSDIWGWTDQGSGRKIAIVGLTNATSFVDVTNPSAPVYLGKLDTHDTGKNFAWRDIKVYNDHAFIVADGHHNEQGMQVFDLRQLLTASPTPQPQNFTETAHYDGFTSAHNIAINEDTGFAYIVGTSRSGPDGGGLHIVDVSDLTNYQFTKAGSFSADGYTHDAQSVMYHGPDTVYAGREIVFAANEDTLTIVDVQDKANTSLISASAYPDSGYAHQGWLSEDHKYFFLDDELDERRIVAGEDGQFGTADDQPAPPSRTLIWNVEDLENPFQVGVYEGNANTIDHNLYVAGDKIYQANYTSGMRILEMTDLENGILTEVGFFDTYAAVDDVSFNGAWSVYPFFDDGTILISDRQGGLFVVQAVPEPSTWVLCVVLMVGGIFIGWRRRRRVHCAVT